MKMLFFKIGFVLMIAHADFDLQYHVDPTMIRVEERCDDRVERIPEKETSIIMHLVVRILNTFSFLQEIFEARYIIGVKERIRKRVMWKK